MWAASFRADASVLLLGLKSLLLAGGLSMTLSASHAASQPVCPSGSAAPYPAYGEPGEAPNVAVWRDLTSFPEDCHLSLNAPAALTIVLSGRFTHSGSVETIAARLGAISASRNLPYWSVTDGDWRTLIAEAFALRSPDTDTVRSDFTGQEMLSGQAMYFAQNDTRSWGLNVYRVRAIQSTPDVVVFDSDNLSPIRLGPVTLFTAGDIRSLLFITREHDTTWAFYGLSVIRNGTLAAREKSLINRQSAFYRLLTGQVPDQEPPLAP